MAHEIVCVPHSPTETPSTVLSPRRQTQDAKLDPCLRPDQRAEPSASSRRARCCHAIAAASLGSPRACAFVANQRAVDRGRAVKARVRRADGRGMERRAGGASGPGLASVGADRSATPTGQTHKGKLEPNRSPRCHWTTAVGIGCAVWLNQPREKRLPGPRRPSSLLVTARSGGIRRCRRSMNESISEAWSDSGIRRSCPSKTA